MFLRGTLLLLPALAAPVIFAQAPQAAPQPAAARLPAYEVISVRQDKVALGWSSSTPPDGYTARGITLMYLLMDAYNIRPNYRIVGAPAWWDDTRFDIQAKVADADIPAVQKLDFLQRHSMIQQILTDRFKLKVHREDKIQPTYSLVVVKQAVLSEKPPPAAGAGGRGAEPGKVKGLWLT